MPLASAGTGAAARFPGARKGRKVMQTPAGTRKHERGTKSKGSHFRLLVSLLWSVGPTATPPTRDVLGIVSVPLSH